MGMARFFIWYDKFCIECNALLTTYDDTVFVEVLQGKNTMRIFVAHATASNFREELYAPLRSSHVYSEHEFILPQENGKEEITKDIIQHCDVVLAEVSLPSTGQGIELGWANVFAVPIICIFKKGARPSGSLQYIATTMVEYDSSATMIEELEKVLQQL